MIIFKKGMIIKFCLGKLKQKIKLLKFIDKDKIKLSRQI